MSASSPAIEAWIFRVDDIHFPAFPQDAKRAAAITDPLRRHHYERTRAALRRVLGLRANIPPGEVAFELAPGGKPFVAGCEFSISHSGAWFVVATADAAVGVDIETHAPRCSPMDLATRFFSKPDVIALQKADAATLKKNFLQQWVAKEAALKAAGTGLAGYLHKAECIFEGAAIRAVSWDATRFCIHEFALPDGSPGALAWRGSGNACIRWRDPGEAAGG